ncbi:MAG: hypothetical protein HY231_03435 [Acidobacteria bacterium]|nr:hypothetical protein [Acidobacteriota bacterium]
MACENCGADLIEDENHECDPSKKKKKQPLQLGGGSKQTPETHDDDTQTGCNGNIIVEAILRQGTKNESNEKESNDSSSTSKSQTTNVNININNQSKDEEEKPQNNGSGNTLFDLSEPLGKTKYQLPDDIKTQAGHFLSVVDKEYLLIVSSPDPGTTYFAGRGLVDMLQIPDDERRRTLDLTHPRDEIATIDIYSLFGKSDTHIDGNMVVIIRCAGTPSARFLDSLFDMQTPDFCGVQDKLIGRGTYLICLIPSQELNRRKISLKRLQCKVWHIDRLGSLLKDYFPDTYESVQDRLLDQRKYGLWSEDEQEFYNEVKTALENGNLPQKLEANQPEIEKKSTEYVIPEDKPLHQMVYYVATFFPDLSPNDFNKVVQVLLGDSTTTISKTITQQSEDGTIRQVTVEVEKPLHELWRTSSDSLRRDCNLKSQRKESTVIAFSKEWMQGHFKKLFEENHSFYLENQFEMIQSTGLLFSPSVKVAENVITLIVDRILTFPDVYDKFWLFNLLRVVNATLEEISALSWMPDIVRFLHAENAKKLYNRLSELIRKMLENASLTKMVNGLLEELMRIGAHESVFEIVKNLRYASNFNEFHWLRQLLEQGTAEIAQSVLHYLFSEMKRLNFRVYEVLHALDGWLPDPNDTEKGYSISGCSPLKLLVKYYEYSMREVTFENHGQWPTTYPLLFAKDSKTVGDNFGLLIRCFFHPWMKAILAEKSAEEEPEIYYYTGSFVVSLSLILLNSPDRDWDNLPPEQVQSTNIETVGTPTAEVVRNEAKERQLRPDDLFEILVQELVKAAAELQQRTVYSELAECWKDYKTLFVHLINQIGYKQPDIRSRLIGAYKTVLYVESEFNRLRVEAVGVAQQVSVS